MTREATILRETAETRIEVTVNLDGAGQAEIATGIGFFDHMLCAFARHGRFDLKVSVRGDLHVDATTRWRTRASSFGQALNRALGDRKGLRRFASACIPMDEALCFTVLDFSNRPFLVFDADMPQPMIGTYDLPHRRVSAGPCSEQRPHSAYEVPLWKKMPTTSQRPSSSPWERR